MLAFTYLVVLQTTKYVPSVKSKQSAKVGILENEKNISLNITETLLNFPVKDKSNEKIF